MILATDILPAYEPQVGLSVRDAAESAIELASTARLLPYVWLIVHGFAVKVYRGDHVDHVIRRFEAVATRMAS